MVVGSLGESTAFGPVVAETGGSQVSGTIAFESGVLGSLVSACTTLHWWLHLHSDSGKGQPPEEFQYLQHFETFAAVVSTLVPNLFAVRSLGLSVTAEAVVAKTGGSHVSGTKLLGSGLPGA